MSKLVIFGLLTLAACLEVGGDALARSGLHGHGTTRYLFLFASALTLLVYGVTVNLGPWDFGRVLGVYVALFFIVAQIVDRLVYGITPSIPIIVGGTLIVSGVHHVAPFEG